MDQLPTIDRSAFQLVSMDESDDAPQYWRDRTPQERLAGLEMLRQIMYGYDPATERLQRILELAELE